MPCLSPLSAWIVLGECGERKVLFKPPKSSGDYLRLPCGKCMDCRLEQSRQWAVRGMHEASLHDSNCFITLTFDADKIDSSDFDPVFDSNDMFTVEDRSYTLVKRDFQLFMKRLRKRCADGFFYTDSFGKQKFFQQKSGIRFLHCGEYGEQLGRPHHHACLFGFDFPDLVPFPDTTSSFQLRRSPILEELWPYGFSSVGRVTFESVAYVARYITKKINGSIADDHYLGRQPEYMTCSRGGRDGHGLAYDWIDNFSDEVFANDAVFSRGVKCLPPRYYNKYLDLTSPFEYANLVFKRVERAESRDVDLDAHSFILNQRFSKLKRSYEYEA